MCWPRANRACLLNLCNSLLIWCETVRFACGMKICHASKKARVCISEVHYHVLIFFADLERFRERLREREIERERD